MKKKEKDKKTGVILVTIFIAVSMTISIFGYVLQGQTDTLKYNGYKFTPLSTGGYNVKIDGKTYTFQYYPGELESLNFSEQTKELLAQSTGIAMLFDPNSTTDDLTYIDYARFSFQNNAGKPVYFAITQESSTYALPVLSCDNATAQIPFIYFNISTESSITAQGDCIIVDAKLQQIVAAEERLSYQMLGVMG